MSWSDSDIKKLGELCGLYSCKDIAKILNRSSYSVEWAIKKFNIQKNPALDIAFPDNKKHRKLDFLGYPGYCVNEHGDIFSRRVGNSVLSNFWKKLKWRPDKDGYFSIQLCNNNGAKNFKIHHLVLFAFIGPKPNNMECSHKDDVKSNNHISNLKWDTHINNELNKKRLGNLPHGSKHKNSKLNESQVKEIRILYKNNVSLNEIATRYKISRRNVSMIVSRKTWKHVQ